MEDFFLCVVARPWWQAFAVGVAGAGEVGPIVRDLIAELAVFRTPLGTIAHVERTEDILELVGVPGVFAFRVHLALRSGQIEAVAVDRYACFGLRLNPLPGSEGNELIGGVVVGCADGFVIGFCGERSEEIIGMRAVVFLGECLPLLHRHVF